MADVSVKVKGVDYMHKLLDGIRKHYAVSAEDVLRGEAVAVCKTMMQWSKVPDEKKFPSRAEKKALRKAHNYFRSQGGLRVSFNTGMGNEKFKKSAGVQGRVWFGEMTEGKWKWFMIANGVRGKRQDFIPNGGGWLISDERWQKYLAYMGWAADWYQSYLNHYQNFAGLIIKSWFMVAVACGLTPSQVMQTSPICRGKRSKYLTSKNAGGYQFGRSSYHDGLLNPYIIAENTSIVAKKACGRKLERAVKSRQRSFEFAMEKKVFKSSEELARRYKGILKLG